ncbi:hypothetical protein BEWA_005150 [Theileria equi strain WA]|uniref:Uncharacterized protein n=1 Tax=Theileria equi strain WA TaxID=1537102 RepID=L0AZS7_THEEQ|nr:hypothetical protein BEWA_005150 [Theileria equi strain WA]AFZ81107.1 hypothetical protein BEWA_005150 [Theileria equi strain WA]|eukprot:XP_004830773.1 hypothetical protein BEWA_005150 [Theileria equi strain WA]
MASQNQQGPSDSKGNTLLLMIHVKKVILKQWIAECLEIEQLKLRWEMQCDGFKPEPNLFLESKSEPFQLNKLEAENVDTISLVTQTVSLDDKITLDDKISLKLELVIDNSPNVVVGTAICKLNTLKIRSQLSPFSFELKNEDEIFIGYVDTFYVSQQRWVMMNKNSLPMIRRPNTMEESTPESEAKDDSTTMSSEYFTDDSPYSANNDNSEDDYVMIFWNSANTCFVRNHPNDVQLQELYTFMSSSLKNGDLNAVIELTTQQNNLPKPQENSLSSTLFKQLTYSDAKTLMHTSQSTPCDISCTNDTSQKSGDSSSVSSSRSALSFTIDEIQHSSRLYTSSLPSVERFLNKPVFNDPTSFYNYISRQNKHFQSILSKRFLSPSSRVDDLSTGRSAISDRVKVPKKSSPGFGEKLIKHTQSTIDTMSSFNNNLNSYSGPSIDTVTTDLVSLENKSSRDIVDEESLTIGDATITTTKTMFSNTTFTDKGQNSARLIGLTEHKLFNIYEASPAPIEYKESADAVNNISSLDPEHILSIRGDYATPICEKSVTVYSLFSPVSNMNENEIHSPDESLYDARSSHDSTSVPDELIELPLKLDNLRNIDTFETTNSIYYQKPYGIDSAHKNIESIRNYFKQPQNAYYLSDQDIDYSQDMDYVYFNGDYETDSLLCESSILDFKMIMRDLNTMSNSSKPSVIGMSLRDCSQETINNALEDAKLLKSQCEILPKAAIIKIFLKYLNFYASEMISVVIHFETITQKQLETIKKISNNVDDVINYIDIALTILISELQSLIANRIDNINLETLPFEFMKQNNTRYNENLSSIESQGIHTSEACNFFLYDTQTTETEIDDFEIDAPVVDKNIVLRNVITTMYQDVGSMGSRRLVYISKMQSVQTKSRGCLIRFSAIKLAFYRTFCGRRKITIGSGQILKV